MDSTSVITEVPMPMIGGSNNNNNNMAARPPPPPRDNSENSVTASPTVTTETTANNNYTTKKLSFGPKEAVSLPSKMDTGPDRPSSSSSSSGRSSSSSSTAFATAVILVATLLLCYVCYRIKRRRSDDGYRTNRMGGSGKYSILHGSDDYFNGTFSDDISIHEKDVDDDDYFDDEYDYEYNYDNDEKEMQEYSDDDDDDYEDDAANSSRTKAVTLEMVSSIHEMEANGGLTLDECNG